VQSIEIMHTLGQRASCQLPSIEKRAFMHMKGRGPLNHGALHSLRDGITEDLIATIRWINSSRSAEVRNVPATSVGESGSIFSKSRSRPSSRLKRVYSNFGCTGDCQPSRRQAETTARATSSACSGGVWMRNMDSSQSHITFSSAFGG